MYRDRADHNFGRFELAGKDESGRKLIPIISFDAFVNELKEFINLVHMEAAKPRPSLS